MSGTQWSPWGRAGTLARVKLRPGGRARIRQGAEQVGCPLPSERVQSQDGCQENGAGEAHSVRQSAGDRTVSEHGFGKAGDLNKCCVGRVGMGAPWRSGEKCAAIEETL